LEDFNGSPLPGTYAGNQLKKFVEWKGFYKPVSSNEEESEQDLEEEENDRKIGGETKDRVVGTGIGEATPNSKDKNKVCNQ
jgi:hypothetical protein